MNIQTELTRITNAKAAVKAAIEGKGVTVPDGTLLDGMAPLIESIEAGGVGVQSDWNQNDETQPDYVKNRPFYTGGPVETVLVEESTVSFAEDRGLYIARFPSTFEATVGETYKVSWDGTVYECACADFSGRTTIGNLSIAGAGSDTGEPFLMVVHNGQGIDIVTAETSASHTFSISGLVPEVVKIDKKYLVQPDWNQNDSTQPDYVKNRPFYTGDPVETVFVEESTVSFAADGPVYIARFPSTFEATVGETYKVSWDGTVYECACADFNSYPVIGNLSIAGAGSDTGEPFLMLVDNGRVIEIYTADTSASHTFSICVFAPEVVKIDEKYLPVASEGNYGVVKKSEIVTSYKFDLRAPHDLMVDAITAFKTGNANIVWSGYKVIDASYDSSNDTISVVFAKEPLEVLTCSNYDGFYIRTLGSPTYEELQGNQVRIVNDEGVYAVLSTKGVKNDTTLSVGAERIHFYSECGLSKHELILKSSTENSTKQFRITVDDSGTITATEVS